ncbi:MAG TPA: pilus assembly protein PilP [Thermodesulfobacteriota bacterium]|nr:pilus assembly protein PilP [Thermodesulfobacteriota bacterium]
MKINKLIDEMINMNKKYLSLIIIFMLSLLLNVGYSDSYAQQDTNTTDEESIEDIDIDLDVFIKDIYSKEQFYSPIDKRDPFKPFIKVVDTKDRELDPDIDPLAPPIKRYKLDQFKLVGVFWLENTAQAMIIDPEKNTYMLQIGDEVGNREGKIVEIRENGISVEEKFRFENADGLRTVKLQKSILAFKQ